MVHYIEKMRSQGFKVTPRRKAIIEVFQKTHGHMTPEDVWAELKDRFDECGLPSIYRNLAELEACGILTKIQQFDRKRHYALCEAKDNEHHHHIVCVKCGKVGDVEACGVEQIKKAKGFKVLSHYVQLNGICEECQLDKK